MVEIILTVALFGMLSLAVLSAFIYGRESSALSNDRSRASQIANEALEAVRNIETSSYSNLASYINGTTYYLTTVSNQWSLITTPQTVDGKYSRTVIFSDGPNGSRQVTVTVGWQQNVVRTGTITAVGYLTNWRAVTAAPEKTGIFVYANGGTTVDTMSYRLLQNTGLWTNALPFPDVDSSTTNRVARSVKLYSAQTGSAKMVLSRHYNGSNMYLYGTYWNGSSFTAPSLLGSWSDPSSSSADSGNYSGGFMADGTFVATYNDKTNFPKYRSFNGANWGTQGSLPSLGSSGTYPSGVALKARPSANEAMVIMIVTDGSTRTSYFANGAWSSYTTHATLSNNQNKIIDLDWSLADKTKAAIVFNSGNSDRSLDGRIFTANGSGGGSWSSVVSTGNQPTGSTIGSVGVFGRPSTTAEFMACDKTTQTTPRIYCYMLTTSPVAFATPINNLVTSATDSGGQRSFDLGYELLSGSSGLNAYSDATSSAKLKLYDSATSTWGTTSIALPNASGTVQKTRVVAKPNSSDDMIIVADANKNLSSVMYNGTNNILYATPAGKAWTSHSTNGPSNSAVWFDFAWDS